MVVRAKRGVNVHTMRMRLGINLPWIDCGHDFGRRPPEWGHGIRPQRGFRSLGARMAAWREEMGIEVLRIWLLAGGVNYPVGERAQDYFGLTQMRSEDAFLSGLPAPLRRRLVAAGWEPGTGTPPTCLRLGDAELPPLSDDFLEDFEALLVACKEAGTKLMPALLSFEFFHPIEHQAKGVLSRGRTALVFGDDGRDVSQIERFLDATLDPILDVADSHPNAIEAVEVINEPDWSTEGGPLHARMDGRRLHVMPKTVLASMMSEFLERAVRRIVARGHRASVGFKQAKPSWLSVSCRQLLQSLGREGRYVHQVHHYPSLYEPGLLAPHASLPIQPCIVGEMPTIMGRALGLHIAWWRERLRDIGRASDPDEHLLRRLQIVEELGYPMALLWSAQSTDVATDWSVRVQSQVARYHQR